MTYQSNFSDVHQIWCSTLGYKAYPQILDKVTNALAYLKVVNYAGKKIYNVGTRSTNIFFEKT